MFVFILGIAAVFVLYLAGVGIYAVTRKDGGRDVFDSGAVQVAAIVAAADAMDCDAVYPEDLNSGQNCGGALMINPFSAA